MRARWWQLSWLVLVSQPLWVAAANPFGFAQRSDAPSARAVPLDKMEPRSRELVRQVLDKPILSGRGPAESFACHPEQYSWFLDHPDRAVVAWRRLGAKCVSINPRPDGKFSWADEYGSEVVWETAYQGPGVRVWYATGKVCPGPRLPLVPMKAVVVMRHYDSRDPDGSAVMHHQCDLFVQTDSKTAAVMARMLGPSATRALEQGLSQLQLFFSGLSWYLDRHPEQTERLLRAGD